MKKSIIVALCVLIIAVLAFTGCTQQPEPTPEPMPSATATPEPTPEPTPTPEPASVVLMDVPEEEASNFPVPEEYLPIDPITDFRVPMNLGGFTAYSFVDNAGVTQFRAFGQKMNPADQSYAGELGWYAFEIEDVPQTAETVKTLEEGERILVLDKETGDIVDTYIIGNPDKPIEDDTIFDTHNVVHRIIKFDGLTAIPVDLEAEAATYQVVEEQPEDGADDVPINDDSASSSKSGNGGSLSSSTSGSESSASGGAPSGSESASSGGSSSGSIEAVGGERDLEAELPDEFESNVEGKDRDLGNGVIIHY